MVIEDLIDGAIHFLKDIHHHKQSSIKHNYQPGFKFIANYYNHSQHDTANTAFFTDCFKSITEHFNSGNLSEPHLIRYRKSLSVLKQYILNGTIHYECQPALSYILPSADNENILQGYINEENIKLAKQTVKTRANIIRQFLRYFEQTGQNDLSNLTETIILSFMEYMSQRRPAGLSHVVVSIRTFLTYLYSNEIIKRDISKTANVKVVRRHKIYGVLTTVEIERILTKIDRDTLIGKRDYALILLSSRNGLRSSDIINLELSNIHWKSAEIVIVQQKTQNTVSCPIDVVTGNALSDYILNVRPSSSFNNVFLSMPPAPRPLTSANLCHLLKKYSNAAGIIWDSTSRLGMHTFRRSLGTHLLENDIVLETISQILGHKSTVSTKQYLSIAEGKLADCTLPMPHYSGLLEVHDV